MQNIRTSLAQVVAEELQVPVLAINMVMGDTDLVPYDAGTFGSRSTPAMGSQLRKAAATARETLLDLAAQEWKVSKSSLKLNNGKVTQAQTNKAITYGKLTQGKQLLQTISKSPAVTPLENWKIAGTSDPKVNGRDFLTSQHKYVSDFKVPGMLYGKVLRAPAFGVTMVSVDLEAAKNIPGIVIVHEKDNLLTVSSTAW